MIYENKLVNFYDFMFDKIDNDSEFYKYFINKNNGSALEIGSGTGRLLLKYLKEGLQIEGLEPSQEMTNFCLKKAESLNIKPKIYQQKLQNINIDKKYKTIFMPLFVFQNIIEKNEITNALTKTYQHLEISGQILISVFMPWNDPTGTWEQTWRISNIINRNSETLSVSESVHFDKFEQIQTKYFKHEVFKDNLLSESYFSEIKFRCYSRFELIMLLEKIGFKKIEVYGDYLNQEADSNSEIFIFSAYK
jgi:SAM-dependent methyltransferase